MYILYMYICTYLINKIRDRTSPYLLILRVDLYIYPSLTLRIYAHPETLSAYNLLAILFDRRQDAIKDTEEKDVARRQKTRDAYRFHATTGANIKLF